LLFPLGESALKTITMPQFYTREPMIWLYPVGHSCPQNNFASPFSACERVAVIEAKPMKEMRYRVLLGRQSVTLC
jgi:hypothetical protein